jgi:hypothetical protein
MRSDIYFRLKAITLFLRHIFATCVIHANINNASESSKGLD